MDTFIESYFEFINEAKIVYKRKYTESYPAKQGYSNSKIKAKILEAIADGKISNDEFNKILKELNANPRWLSRNSSLFKVNEEGVSLSKLGAIILNKSKAKSAPANKESEESFMTTFEEFTKNAKLKEEIMLNPGMNVVGMGPVKFPGNAGTTTAFHGQNIGSGDTAMFIYDPAEKKDDEEDEEKKMKELRKILDKKKKKKD